MQQTNDYDIVIVGAGVVGLSLALALGQHTKLRIAIIDKHMPQQYVQLSQFDTRVSAINRATQHFFSELGIWASLSQQRISPYTQIQIWDAVSQAALSFSCHEIAAPNLGHIVEHQMLQTTLLQKLADYATINIIAPLELMHWETNPAPCLYLADGRYLSARLFIAADGANSWLRGQAKIALSRHDYEQTALVATVKTQLPHQATAYQVFLPTGPLAFLPLADPHACSIVWSTTPQQAANLLALSESEFATNLASAFANRLGEVQLLSARLSFPLRAQHVEQYIKPGLALVGDAAHTVHPFAGQGLNIGLADAKALAAVITQAQQLGRDFADIANLRKYERRSRTENKLQLTLLHMLRQLFAKQAKPFLQLRQWGLHGLNHYKIFKKPFMWQALGARH